MFQDMKTIEMTIPQTKAPHIETNFSAPFGLPVVAGAAEPVLATPPFVLVAPFPVVVAPPPLPTFTLAAEIV